MLCYRSSLSRKGFCAQSARRPRSAGGLVQRDERRPRLRLRGRQLILRVEQRALRIEHLQEIGEPRLEPLLREIAARACSTSPPRRECRAARARDRTTTTAVSVSSSARSTVDVYCACASSCAACATFTRSLHAAEVEQRKPHDRTEQHARHVAVRERRDAVRRVAGARAERQARQVVGLRRADEQRLRRELSLGREHVGTTTNELARRADRHRVRQARQRCRRSSNSAGTASGARPSSVAMRLRSRGDLRLRVPAPSRASAAATDFARSTSNAVPRPAARRSSVSASVLRCTRRCAARPRAAAARRAARSTCARLPPRDSPARPRANARRLERARPAPSTLRRTRPNTSSSHDASKPTS